MPPPTPLPRGFYDRDVVAVAHDLLGCLLVHGERGGRIVEVEAYGGIDDPGSHAARAGGARGRAAIMFGAPGFAYVYLTYGMHHCLNAVADAEGVGSAVLIRALEPLWDVEGMREGVRLTDHKLASGPGRLCRALRVDRTHNAADLTTGDLRICTGVPVESAWTTTRIGLSADDDREWRFVIDSPSLSR